MAAVSCPLAVFKVRKLHFSLAKTDARAAPGKPLIFHGFAPECPESQDELAPVHILS
jgi:hypothetical protein